MPSYYEALPIYKVAMDVAVRVDAVVQHFANGHHPGWPSAPPGLSFWTALGR
jgi:hypothetical protein